jgi:hypothetical protein
MHDDHCLIQHFAPEILAKVFTFCVPESSLVSTRTRSSVPPLSLCKVCSTWRSLANSTPQLWKNLSFHISRDKEKTYADCLVEGVRAWLKRSGALPLTIRLTVGCVGEVERTTELRICAALSECASRWEHVDISTNIPLASWPRLGVLPFLHTLRICRGFRLQGPTCDIPFDSAPRLRILTLPRIPTTPTSVSSIPWRQLTELVVDEEMTLCMVLEIIKWCDLLELLAIMKVGGPHANSVTPASPRITHRALRIINFTFDQDCRPLFESLILPALTTLSLAYKAQSLGKTPFFMELIDLFSQSNCELQELSLSDSEFTKLALLECLGHKSCESLTSLRVTNMPWNHFAIMVDDELIM